jgi:Xaa-Pro dipeptidase
LTYKTVFPILPPGKRKLNKIRGSQQKKEKSQGKKTMNGTNIKLEKILKLMKEKELQGLIIYSNGICNILRPSYLHYFAEFKPLGTRNAAVVSQSGAVSLIVSPAWDAVRASAASWITDVHSSVEFVEDLRHIMDRLNIKGKVGLVGAGEMVQEVYAAIASRVETVKADDLIEEVAQEKTDKELDLIRKTARIADIGADAFAKSARKGIREYELVAELEFAMRSAGADDIFILLSSGRHNDEMHEPTDRRLQEGDIVIGEISPVCDGQFMQLCRTVVLGAPDPVLTDKYGILIRALEASFQVIKSGAPAAGITAAMNRVFGEAGYADYCRPPYMRSRGHGFGIGSIQPGAELSDKMQVNLSRHQVVAVHPNQYIPETGYLACGETVLVTDTGVERLAGTETRLYVNEE